MYSWALSLTTLSFSFFIWKMVKLIVSQSRLQGSNENFNMCFWDISCWSKRYNSNQIKYMGVFINSCNRELKVQGWLRHGWMGAFSAYIQNLLLLQLLALLDFGWLFSQIFSVHVLAKMIIDSKLQTYLLANTVKRVPLFPWFQPKS